MQLQSILCAAFSILSVTPLIFCVTDFVSAKKQNVSFDLWQKILVWVSSKIVGLDLAPFNEMIENRCCRNTKTL